MLSYSRWLEWSVPSRARDARRTPAGSCSGEPPLVLRWAASLSGDRSSVCPEEIDQEDAQAGDEAEGSAHDAHHEQGMSLQQANEPVGGFGGCVRRHVGAPVPIALRSACRAPMGGDGWTVIARDALGPYDTTRRGRPWDPALADLLRSNDKAPSSWTTLPGKPEVAIT